MKKLLVGVIASAVLFIGSAFAGNFDCSVVYDEYTSLMNKSFIANPAAYVNVQSGQMSRNDYNSIQKGKFLVNAANTGWGVAIFRTNKNTYGKFHYTWGAPIQNGQPSLIIRDLVKFGRVMDGFGEQALPTMNIISSYTLDIDSGKYNYPGSSAEADIWFNNVDGNTMYVKAINGANIYFPTESMCK